MAQLKSNEIDAWLSKPRQPVPVVLVYGPDRGLVSERAALYASHTGLPLDDPFSVVRLDASDLDKDAGRLLDEANTIPMFAGRRLLWVRNAGAQKSLGDDVKALCKAPPADCLVLIEAGDLKKTAALRSVVESSSAGLAIPCYVDDVRGVDGVIDDELGKAGLAIDPEARQLLRRGLGGDRLASRAEVQKLVLYAMGTSSVTADDVRASTGDVSGLSVDDAVATVIDGDIAGFDAAFARQMQAGGQTYPLLSGAMRLLQNLHVMRGTMEKERRNAGAMVTAARPPIFFARRKAIEQALDRWDSAALSRALARLQDTVLQTRRRPDLATALARQALLGIAVESARRARR